MSETHFPGVLRALDQAGIAHAVLRDQVGNDPSDDLDLLIWPEDRSRFTEIVEGLGFRRSRHRVPKKAVYFAWREGQLQVLDVHYALVQGGLTYLPLPPRESIVQDAPPRLAPADELLHLIFHGLLGKGGIAPKRLPRVRALIGCGAGDRVVRRLTDPVILGVVRAVIANPEQHGPGSARGQEASRRIRIRLLRRPANLWHRLRYLALRRFRPHRGLLVAFMGVDGAGKTTAIDRVTSLLEGTGRVRVVRTYLGPWGHFRTEVLRRAYSDWGFTPTTQDWLGRLGDRLRGRREAPSILRCLNKWARGRVRGCGYYAAVYYDLWKRYMTDVRPALSRGKVILSDRYIYDLRYLHQNRPISTFPVSRRLLTRLFPRPHLIFLLRGDPARIAARKAQLTPEQIGPLQATYRRALSGLPVIEVNTNESVEVVADRITGEIAGTYFSRR